MADMKVSEQIRKLIEDAPVSRHRLCMLADVNTANMAQFMAGKRGLSQETLDAVGLVLGFKVTMDMTAARKVANAAPGPGRPAKEKTQK